MTYAPNTNFVAQDHVSQLLLADKFIFQSGACKLLTTHLLNDFFLNIRIWYGKNKNISERHRNANPTPTTSHDASQPTVTEEPSGETSMEIPLPNTPQASRPGTPEDFGPTSENCRKLQELTTIIHLYSTTLESTHLLLKGVRDAIGDPNNPIIGKETSYMELTNERLQQAVSEYASFPCDNPNCTRHTSNNSPDPSPPPTTVPTKRKENED
ncbi:hypothetical protein TNCV_4302851 [Trichonephila clavipes]|nr:hypothetical protein TNCV_4302851 [Trichonephila clavipes]